MVKHSNAPVTDGLDHFRAWFHGVVTVGILHPFQTMAYRLGPQKFGTPWMLTIGATTVGQPVDGL